MYVLKFQAGEMLKKKGRRNVKGFVVVVSEGRSSSRSKTRAAAKVMLFLYIDNDHLVSDHLLILARS